MLPLTQTVTGAELAVLRRLWERAPATIRQLTDALYPEGEKAHYATVQKLLERLETKGCVRRDDSERVHRFAPAVEREEFIGQRLRAVATTLGEGSLTPLLSHLVKTRQLSRAERQSLRELIDEMDRPGTSSD